jgi:hypothetical protein
MSYEGDAGNAIEIGGGRRLAVAPDALSVDVRGGGRWIRSRVVPYEDIRAVYRYERLDVTAMVAVAVLWLALVIGLLIWGTISQWGTAALGAGALLLTAVLGAVAFIRARTAPARMLRIEAYSGVLLVPDRSADFFRSIAARIRVLEAPTANSIPHHPAHGELLVTPPSSTEVGSVGD